MAWLWHRRSEDDDRTDQQRRRTDADRTGAARAAGRQLRQPARRHRHPRGSRRPHLGHQRQRVCRFPAGLRSDVRRPLPSRRDGSGAGAAAARHHVLRQQRARHPAGRRDRRCGGLRREGALRQQRHRGRRLRHARRPRVPWPRQDPQVRGRLSRHERLQPDEPGAEAPWQLPAGGAGFARHPTQRARRDDHRAVQRSGDGGEPDPRAPRRTGRRDRRAVPAPAAAEARLPAGAARCDAPSTAFR